MLKMTDLIISEERLKKLMKETFKEEFEKQQNSLLNLTGGNLYIPTTEIKKVQSDINELQVIPMHTEAALKEEVAKAEK